MIRLFDCKGLRGIDRLSCARWLVIPRSSFAWIRFSRCCDGAGLRFPLIRFFSSMDSRCFLAINAFQGIKGCAIFFLIMSVLLYELSSYCCCSFYYCWGSCFNGLLGAFDLAWLLERGRVGGGGRIAAGILVGLTMREFVRVSVNATLFLALPFFYVYCSSFSWAGVYLEESFSLLLLLLLLPKSSP